MRIIHAKKYRTTMLSVISSLLLISSCTKDFADVNANKLLPGEKERQLDGLASGGLFPSAVGLVIPTRSGGGTGLPNMYQVTIDMTGDNWIGYFSPGAYPWDGGNSLPNYYAGEGRLNGLFDSMNEIMNNFLQMKMATHRLEITPNKEYIFHKKGLTDQAVFSVAQIIKIMAFHRSTDMFGPLPYSQIKPGETAVPYDSQEAIYRSFYEELKEAIATLNRYKESSATIIADYDPVYQGKVENWVKLGNSLMLRLGMRVRFADAALARDFISTATDPNNGGLITEVKDAARLISNGRYRFFHSLYTLSETYNEVKMGATIYSYLKGFNDPRLEKYFTKGKVNDVEDYYAVRLGVQSGDYKDFSKPIIEEASPTYWIRASEVQFLLAEARLENFISDGSVKEYYEKGITYSFQESGASLGNYLTATGGKQANYNDPLATANNIVASNTTDKVWDEASSSEEKLEKIITQKYLAIFPDGLEAWSEWRRTGYPRIFKEVRNATNIGANNVTATGRDGGVRRLPFTQKEIRLNTTNVLKARTLLEGPDNAATNVWWDKKTK